jgi:hypothetical protein
MTTAAARKIAKDTFEGPRVERKIHTGTTLKPGHFVIFNSAGSFIPQATSGGGDAIQLLLEDKYQGDATAGGGVDKVYTVGDMAEAEYPAPGALRYVRVATGQTLVLGDQLIFNGAAALIKTTGTPVRIIATSEEAITTSGEQLVLVRIAS